MYILYRCEEVRESIRNMIYCRVITVTSTDHHCKRSVTMPELASFPCRMTRNSSMPMIPMGMSFW